MLIREAKLKDGTSEQYQALDEAIRTGQFIRNKCLRLWMDKEKIGKSKMQSLCKDLAQEFPFAKKLNSMARQVSTGSTPAHADRAWVAVKHFKVGSLKLPFFGGGESLFESQVLSRGVWGDLPISLPNII